MTDAEIAFVQLQKQQMQIDELTARVDRYRNDLFWLWGAILLTPFVWFGAVLIVAWLGIL